MRLLNRSAGRLSRHRRGPIAGLVVVLLGLLMTGGIYTAFFSSASADESATSAEQVQQGRELFLVSCAFCHGQNGEGVRTSESHQIGPSLVGVGAAAVDFQVGTGRMPMVQPGAQAPQKTPAFTEDETAALAAYVQVPDQLRDELALVGVKDPDLSHTVWYWAAVVGALLAGVAGALAVAWVPAWPEMGTKYDAPGSAAPAPVVPPEEQSSLDLWKAMDEGRDPTA